ncbi:50S ribosomal protein L9 [Patescibacteria group bacterium]|nr:50S ribosomal protein L9 [Patescibacteria group bacterium]
MNVILQDTVQGLGKKGDIARVSDGYARNFLVPKGLAVPADTEALEKREMLLEKRQSEGKEKKEQLQKYIEHIEGKTFSHTVKADETGALFGSIREKDIAEIMGKDIGEVIDARYIAIKEPVKKLGDHTFHFKLDKDTQAKATLHIEKE